MKNKKQYKIEDIKNLTESIERIKGNSILTDVYGNKIDIIDATAQADADVEKIQSANVHFRWSKKEIERAKIIAEAKGLKYQAYIKSILKQQMDKDLIELRVSSGDIYSVLAKMDTNSIEEIKKRINSKPKRSLKKAV